jgi:2,3-bisphosphoglycerate-independent phosphoglycerate mutase
MCHEASEVEKLKSYHTQLRAALPEIENGITSARKALASGEAKPENAEAVTKELDAIQHDLTFLRAANDIHNIHFAGKLERKPVVKPALFVCFTEYDESFGLPVAFHSETPKDILGERIAAEGLLQLRIAETEKYAHVTYFFNGGSETPFPGEERVVIPSPRDVATYDHKPEMSAMTVTEELLRRLAREDFAFILLNYANPDMVGHTGVLAAAIKAVETIDRGLERLCDSVLARGGAVLITADHGNCEQMVDPVTGQPHTAHTTNPVPLIWVANDHAGRKLRDGGLADLAPTVMELMGLRVPAAMTGHSLIVPA